MLSRSICDDIVARMSIGKAIMLILHIHLEKHHGINLKYDYQRNKREGVSQHKKHRRHHRKN